MDPVHGIATGTPVANREYSYDPAGDVTSLNDTVSGDSQCFTYDYVQRLISAWTPGAANSCGTAPSSGSLGGPAPYWQSYSYDTVGDRTQIVRHAVTTGGTDTTDSYVYASPVTGGTGLVDAVSSVAHAGAVTGTDTYTYDSTGDTLTRPGGVSLAYDAEGRLVKATSGTGSERDVYDADGTQLVQVQTGGPHAGATVYLGDTQLFVAAGTTTTIGTRTYSVAGQSLAVRVATPSGPYQTALYWTGLDAQHTADQVTRTNTTSLTGVQSRYFDPFGAERGTSPTTWPDQYGFLNNTTNNLTGTTHLGARDYDPTLGKFTTVDPVLAPTDPQSLNGYSYTANNPVTTSDPSGLRPADDSGGITGGELHQWQASQNMQLAAGVAAERVYNGGCPATRIDTCGTANQRSLTVPPPAPGSNAGGSHDSSPFGFLKKHWKAIAATTAIVAVNLIPVVGELADAALVAEAAAEAAEVAEAAEAAAEAAEAAEAGEGAATTVGRDAATRCLNSFTSDTPVTMADGTQEPISKVKVGDKVLATDPETRETKSEQVVQLIRHTGQHAMVLVTLADGSVLDATNAHPIWDATTGTFTDASTLRVGDKIETTSGGLLTITGLTSYSADLTAYNLQIDTIHTYYAGSTPVLVHNSCDPSVTFGHGARHLAGTGLSDTEVESAIQSQVGRSVANASSTGSFYGRVTVRGAQIEYRAYTLPDGTINVGTYYVP